MNIVCVSTSLRCADCRGPRSARGVCGRHFDPPPYHPGLPRKGRIYTRAPARCEDSRAIAPYRILEVGASFGRPERPEMRDTRLSAYKRTHVAPRSSYRRIPTFVRTNLAGRAQKLPSARLLSWYDRAKLRSSWLIVVAVLRRESPI